MELILEHVDKGCLQYPLPCEDMYIDTHLQPKTRLQERMALQGTSKVESVNAEVNRIVDGVSQLDRTLTEPYIFFKVAEHNHKRDKALGREDPECVWLDAHKCDAINVEASRILHGPLPFPCASEPRTYAQLPPPAKFVFIPEGDPNDEAFGFDYLDHILAREAERDALRDALRDAAAEVRGTPVSSMQGGGPGMAPLSTDHGGADSACSDDDLDDPSPPAPTAARKRKRSLAGSDNLGAPNGGQQRSASMKMPISRAFGAAPTKLRVCKPTSAEERCLAKLAANQAYVEQPAGTKKTFDRATAIYNQKVAAKAATDKSFMLHKTTSRHMKEFLFQSQACYVAAIRLDRGEGHAGTNLARPCVEASNVENARDAAMAGPTADAVQHAHGVITLSALHDPSPPPNASVDAVPSVASPKSNAPAVTNVKLPTNPPTEPPKKSKHSAYNSRERSAELVVQRKEELKGLNVIELKRVARLLGIQQKVAGVVKTKEALLADIEANWTDTHAISLPESLSPSS
jgi:hypothetical protein